MLLLLILTYFFIFINNRLNENKNRESECYGHSIKRQKSIENKIIYRRAFCLLLIAHYALINYSEKFIRHVRYKFTLNFYI